MRPGPDVYASAFLTALAAAACAVAYRLGPGDVTSPGPGFMPLATAALLGVMALVQLGRQLVAAVGNGAAQIPTARGRWVAVLVVLGALAGFGRVLETVGLTLSTFVLLAVLFGVVARKRWWISLLAAALIAAILRLAVRALGVPLPEGPLGV